MFHDALHDSCGVHGEKNAGKSGSPGSEKNFPGFGREKSALRHTESALSHLACIVPATARRAAACLLINPLFRIMTKIARVRSSRGPEPRDSFIHCQPLGGKTLSPPEPPSVSIRIVLESLLRNCDGLKVTERTWTTWPPGMPAIRVPINPVYGSPHCPAGPDGRPSSGGPGGHALAVAGLGKDASVIEPLVPVDLVVDHSVRWTGRDTRMLWKRTWTLNSSAMRNATDSSNGAKTGLSDFSVVPPSVGIVHQVNLEYLARGVMEKDGVYFPDTLVGTDSHTTMINGIGVVGWGVGGIEGGSRDARPARHVPGAGSSGRPYDGRTPRRVTATDLALHVADAAQPRRRRQICGILRRRGGGPASRRTGLP